MPAKIYIPRPIRLLTQFGANALKPTIVQGKYFGPMVSRRVAAGIRKRAIVEGTYGSFIPYIGGWDSQWDEPKHMHLIKPLKCHIEERNREDRAKKIDAAMKAMPDKIKKYEQERNDRKPKKDLFFQFKRLAQLSGPGPRK